MDRKLHRPSKPMMLAVNASIDGDKEEITRLMKEHQLIPSELEKRLAGRDENNYSFERKPRGSKQIVGDSNDVVSMINETTKTAVLIVKEQSIG